MRFSLSRVIAVAFLIIAGAGVSWTSVGGGLAFNSEEHRLIGDRGAAAVQLPASVVFPAGIEFKPMTGTGYFSDVKAAKQLAVGYQTNDQDQWGKFVVAQDNCYFHRAVDVMGIPVGPNTFTQSDYNVKIWITPEAAAPARVLRVPGLTKTGGSAHPFTFGELVAFYGDYRQLPYCDGDACYMTHGNIDHIAFVWPENQKYCPQPFEDPGDYLTAIASGLVPPVGSLGNALSNTASETQYGNAGWWGDEMMRIATVNDWHFSNVAVAWYVGMHRLALLYADSARQHPGYWYKALHYEANALHSLTDLFAFGHVVTAGDETSFDVVATSKLVDTEVYRRFAHMLTLGGARREEGGKLTIGLDLPDLTAQPISRNTMQVTRPSLANYSRKKAEKDHHDAFNKSGGTVKNLRGDQFRIFGDGQLSAMMGTSSGGASAAIEAVRASLQSLFDNYDKLTRGASIGTLSRDTSLFSALRLIPAYVVTEPNNFFNGRWTSYAHAINELSGAGRTVDRSAGCTAQYVSGKSSDPTPVVTGACDF